MKKILILFLLSGICFAQNLKDTGYNNSYKDYFEYLNLTNIQRQNILKIRKEENFVLRPLVLDVSSKERGLELLYNLKCDFFDKSCKKRLKEDIEKLEFEKNEVLRRIEQKRNYYSVRYKNLLTREQNIKLEQMLKDDIHKQKVLKEREERQKRQDIINKLKIWENPKLKFWERL